MVHIIGLTREQLFFYPIDLALEEYVAPLRLLSKEEVVYIATTLGAFWAYDYGALKKGRPGLHAELKSGLHSDGFFVSEIMLEPLSIRLIMAGQLAIKFNQLGMPKPDWVVGIPDGATELGKLVSFCLGAKNAEMKKEEGNITLVSEIPAGQTLLLVEDFCTRGTGFKEAVTEIMFNKRLAVEILPFEMVLINRGGLNYILVEGVVRLFHVVALAEHRVKDWKPEDCPLCKAGSKPIKPKATDENWRLITTSQLS